MTKIIVEAKLNFIPETEVQDRLDFLGDAWEVVSAQTVGVPYHGGQENEFRGPYQGNTHIMYITTVALKQNKKFRPASGKQALRSESRRPCKNKSGDTGRKPLTKNDFISLRRIQNDYI